jgi:hypothetical protein
MNEATNGLKVSKQLMPNVSSGKAKCSHQFNGISPFHLQFQIQQPSLQHIVELLNAFNSK